MTSPRIAWEPYAYTVIVGESAPPMFRPVVVDGPNGYALPEHALQAEADRLSALGFNVDPLPPTDKVNL